MRAMFFDADCDASHSLRTFNFRHGLATQFLSRALTRQRSSRQIELAAPQPVSAVEQQTQSLLHEIKAMILEDADEAPFLLKELLASVIQEITLDVGDRGKGRNYRYWLRGGEINLAEGCNMLKLS